MCLPLVVDFAPMTIDNSQPVDAKFEKSEAAEQLISLDTKGKKMFRERSPKETYFNKIVTAGQTSSSFGSMYQKQDLIK